MATTTGRRKRVRFTLDVNFESDVTKQAFTDKLTTVRNLLTPRGSLPLDNREFLLALFDCALSNHRSDGSDDVVAPSTGSFLRNGGSYYDIPKATYLHTYLAVLGVLTDMNEEQKFFVAEQQVFCDLCQSLSARCADGGRWKLVSTFQV